ncbi:hypothetical protein ABQE70_15230 [Xanthomonas campestris pv. campestris]|uniref:hypothetical protein n=1 Tax=Xanthomonas campestris TaxID=339 RepID=UPI001CBD2FE1|nr:hypothetical protein [Xanthomonas campestris]UAU33791.1 hypothetical protein JH290_16515 [Xanthomonas campestris pv. incanae]
MWNKTSHRVLQRAEATPPPHFLHGRKQRSVPALPDAVFASLHLRRGQYADTTLVSVRCIEKNFAHT